jgi:hypothetical protein
MPVERCIIRFVVRLGVGVFIYVWIYVNDGERWFIYALDEITIDRPAGSFDKERF